MAAHWNDSHAPAPFAQCAALPPRPCDQPSCRRAVPLPQRNVRNACSHRLTESLRAVCGSAEKCTALPHRRIATFCRCVTALAATLAAILRCARCCVAHARRAAHVACQACAAWCTVRPRLSIVDQIMLNTYAPNASSPARVAPVEYPLRAPRATAPHRHGTSNAPVQRALDADGMAVSAGAPRRFARVRAHAHAVLPEERPEGRGGCTILTSEAHARLGRV